jgi:isocitrate lyase
LGTVDSTANKAPLPDPDDRKHPPESVNEVIENLVIASEAMDIDNRKRPPEIANEVMDIVVVTTEAVDMHNHVIVANVETPPSKVSHSSNVAKPPQQNERGWWRLRRRG